jgi:hypothetical protein
LASGQPLVQPAKSPPPFMPRLEPGPDWALSLVYVAVIAIAAVGVRSAAGRWPTRRAAWSVSTAGLFGSTADAQRVNPGGGVEVIDLHITAFPRTAYVSFNARVRNTGTRALNQLVAVINCYDAAGFFVTATTAMADYSHVPPGDIAPFSAVLPSNIARIEVEFTKFGRLADRIQVTGKTSARLY